MNRKLIDKNDASAMRAWADDGGFSPDRSVSIQDAGRMGLKPGLPTELNYCARPPFALAHLPKRDAEHDLVYRNPGPARETALGACPAAQVLTPHELITKIAPYCRYQGRIAIATMACSRPMNRCDLW